MNVSPHILLFDLYHDGHHGQYIRVLLDHWTQEQLPGRLDLVVSKGFEARFPDVAATVARHSSPRLRLFTAEPSTTLNTKTGRLAVLQNDVRIGWVLRKYVNMLRPDHGMLMYFDHLQFSLATHLRFGFPVSFSGIFFRPSFHYRHLTEGATTFRQYLNDVQKQLLLWGALRNPHFDTLFCTDPYAVPYVEQLQPRARAVHMPEAFSISEADSSAATRQRLGVEPGRKVLLLFGALDPRKGVTQLLDALETLPDDLAGRVCLLMAGKLTASIREAVHRQVADLQKSTSAQVILLDEFVPEAEIQNLFDIAALVLLPYQFHVGSSGILVRAASATVPVLGPAYGLLGALIRQRQLGLCVDTTDPEAIRDGLVRFLKPAAAYPFDDQAARSYASENTDEAMAATVFRHLLRPTKT